MGISQPNKLKDKEQELSQKLRDTEAELNNKREELEKAGNENKEKSALIEELKNTIQTLQENVEDYKQQIASINAELATLRTNFDSNQQSTNPQASVKQTNNTQDSTDQNTQPENNNENHSTTQNTSTTNPEITQDSIDIHNSTGFLAALNKLLEEIEEIKKGLSKKGLSKEGKKRIDNAKFALNQYEKQLKNKKKALLNHKGEPSIYDEDIKNLQNIKGKVDELKKGIYTKGQWDEPWSPELPYNTTKNAKKSNTRQAESLKLNQQFQEELKDGAIKNIFNGNIEKANDFFRRIAEGEYTQADYQLFVTNAAILKPCCQRYGINIPTNPMGTLGKIETVQGAPKSSIDYSNMDFGEAFQQGGVSGVLDKLLSNCGNLTPGQKETWKSVGVLGIIAGSIYGLYKFYTNKNMSFWSKAGVTAASIFGSQFLTGEGPLSLFGKILNGGLSMNELKDKFGNVIGTMGLSNGNETASTGGESVSETVAPAMYSMMIFNSSTKVSDIRRMTESFKDNNNRKIFYDQSCEKLRTEYGKYGNQVVECFRARFSDQFDERKWKERLESFGVTDSTDQNESIYGLANNATMNTAILDKFKADNGLKENADNEALKQYINEKKNKNQPIDVDDLNKHIGPNDRFIINQDDTQKERSEDTQNKKKLEDKVESLPLDSQNKDKLKIAIKRFYDERTIESKPNPDKFNLKMNGNFLILTSHGGYETKINLKNRSLEGFGSGDGIPFTNLSDLLNAADLTNKILESQKGKIAVDTDVFQYKQGLGIYFNTAKGVRDDLISFKWSGTDTRVLSSGRWGASKKIEEIDKHLGDYAKYLSNRRNEINNIPK